mgnify:CR=1 FL=1
MLTSKSRSVVARPATVFSADWARENKDLYEDFNTTAFYLTPTDVDNEFYIWTDTGYLVEYRIGYFGIDIRMAGD